MIGFLKVHKVILTFKKETRSDLKKNETGSYNVLSKFLVVLVNGNMV